MSRPSTEQESSGAGSQPVSHRDHRPVRSFVLRAGRLTVGQKRALQDLWPEFGVATDPAAIQPAAVFGNDLPVVMEIGFGNGDATWQMAAAEPDKNFLGVEVHRPGVGHLLLKIEEQGLANVRIACEDAVELLEQRLSPASLHGVRIYFPDPWHKKRHHKRRIIQPDFVALLADRLAPGGVLHLATDWAPYAEWMLQVMSESAAFRNQAEDGGFCERPPWRPRTKYERRGQSLGHDVFDLVFLRRSDTGD